MKLKNEWQWLVGVGISILAHNLISGFLGREEVVFFGLTFVFLLGFIISILNRWLKNYWLVMLVLIILGIDFAALDDITTGNEPNYLGEYAILLVSIPILFLIFKRTFGKKETEEITLLFYKCVSPSLISFTMHPGDSQLSSS